MKTLSRIDLMWRVGVFAIAGLALSGIAACTTIEGTNAFVDAGTFEREVMSETLIGIGIIDREGKAELSTPRGPLVLPTQTASLPTPTESAIDQLPEDSDTVQIDTTGITEADMQRLRGARVIDLRSLGGRPLTAAETRQLTARMIAAGLTPTGGSRPLYLPPDRYFTTVNNQDLICLAPNGDLVPLTDPACPEEIRAILQAS